MTTLYYLPGACSLSPHIVLREAGLAFDLDRVDRATQKTASGKDYRTKNPLGYVPALELDDGTVLTEGPAIVQYIADQVPDRQLAPPAGTIERYRLQSWLNLVTSELHKSFSPLFNPAMPEDTKNVFRERLLGRFGWVDQQLAGRDYLMGDRFSVADAYLYVVSTWAPMSKLDLSGLANLAAFQARVRARPSVQAAMAAEGLK
ncbi:MAG: glutathione transferase GstA [Lautropia sp.]